MSRGLGAIQRQVLAVIKSHPDGIVVADIHRHIGGNYESVRRAADTLWRRGQVQLYYSLIWGRGKGGWYAVGDASRRPKRCERPQTGHCQHLPGSPAPVADR
jgi:hypothetical protein